MDKQAFALLYHKYLSGSCTPEELESFQRYLLTPEADETLRELLQESYAGIRNHSATMVDADGNLIPSGGSVVLPHLLPRTRRLRRTKNISLAFSAALLVCLGGWIAWENSLSPRNAAVPATHSSATARAEYKKLTLPDSTIVWLNAGSRLDFPEKFGSGIREVTLSGEASFDVRHAAERPFLIHTGRIVTRVLGTAFNIKAYPELHTVTVSVSRGRVQVIRDNETVATLIKGQQVRVNNEDSARPLRKTISITSVADWQNGNLDYDDQTLGEVVADLGRVFNSDIRIRNVTLRDMRISTRLRRSEGLPQALEILSRLTGGRVDVRNNVYFFE